MSLLVLAKGGAAEEAILDNVEGGGELLPLHRVELGEGERLAGGLRGEHPAVGLVFGHAGGDDAFAVDLALLGSRVIGLGGSCGGAGEEETGGGGLLEEVAAGELGHGRFSGFMACWRTLRASDRANCRD
jgi:hypothetical protein